MPSKLQETRQTVLDLNEERRQIVAAADLEKRNFSYAEQIRVREIRRDIDEARASVQAMEEADRRSRERVAAQFHAEARAES